MFFNTTTSGTLDGSRNTSPSVPSVWFLRELPSPLAGADIVGCGDGDLLRQWLVRNKQEQMLTKKKVTLQNTGSLA